MQERCIEKMLESIRENICENKKVDIEELMEVYRELKSLQEKFFYLLKRAYEYDGSINKKSLEKLLINLQSEDISHLIDSLEREGRRAQGSIKESFEKIAYRILELIRTGKRSDVMYIITRIYITNDQRLPEVLLEAFKPIYDTETFKTLMYAFIGAIIEPEREQVGGKGNE